MRREKLTSEELRAELDKLEGWESKDDMIVRRLKFANFAESLAFVNKVGELAEAADHHPDITFGWGYAEIALTTHDRGGVTDFDFELARKMDAIQ